MATRSPSPNPCRPQTHTNKTPESANSLRSKEIPPWNSFTKSSSPRTSLDLNENKDPNFLKPLKLKSPVVSASKGPKNFMSPTISASSKAVPASPIKKILQERNEIITPVSDSLKLPVKAGVRTTHEVGVKSEMSFGSQEVLGGCGLKKDSVSKNHQTDAVPPPYDPKNNYLSPRPKFLHYKPSPRIEHYLDREEEVLDVGDGRRLEESSKDDETVLTEKDLKVEELAHVDEVEQSRIHVTQPALKSVPFNSHSCTRFRLAPLLLVMVMACVCAPLSDSPIISSSSLLLQNHSLPKLYSTSYGVFEGLQSGDVNLQVVASRFKHWSTSCINYFTSVASHGNVGLYHLVNMTSSDADETEGLGVCYVHEIETPEVVMESEPEEIIASGVVIESGDASAAASKDEVEEIDMGRSEDAGESHFGAQSFEIETSEVGLQNHDKNEEMNTEEEAVQVYAQQNNEVMETEEEIANGCTEALSVGPEVVVVQEDSSDVVVIDHAQPKNSLDLKVVKLMDLMSVLGFFLPLVLLAATLPFLFSKKQKKKTVMIQKERLIANKVKSVSGSSEIYTTLKDSLNNEETISEFGPSEVSSSWNHESQRRLRRDSAASSSTSYGSFTTYEKLSIKKGYRDEEVVTPVRRSSRIRILDVLRRATHSQLPMAMALALEEICQQDNFVTSDRINQCH